MFDIGFSELVVIGIVALVVIGPERLPKVARTAGHLFGRLQRYVAGVKADIAREMELEELRKFKGEMENAARSMSGSLRQEFSLAEQEIKALKSTVENSIAIDSAEVSSHEMPSTELPLVPSHAASEWPESSSQFDQTQPQEATPSPQMELSLDSDFESKRVGK